MERRLMQRGMAVEVKPITTRHNRSAKPRQAVIVDPLPFPERPNVAEVEWTDTPRTVAAVTLRRIVKRQTVAA